MLEMLLRELLGILRKLVSLLIIEEDEQTILWWIKGVAMDVSLKVGQSVPFFIIGTDANGQRTGSVGTGQTVQVVASNASVTLTPDTTPQPAPDGGPSLASGKLAAVSVGTVTLTANLMNADGTVAATATATVTVMAVTPGPATAISIVFGTPA